MVMDIDGCLTDIDACLMNISLSPQVLPGNKARKVKELQSSGAEVVAMTLTLPLTGRFRGRGDAKGGHECLAAGHGRDRRLLAIRGACRPH